MKARWSRVAKSEKTPRRPILDGETTNRGETSREAFLTIVPGNNSSMGEPRGLKKKKKQQASSQMQKKRRTAKSNREGVKDDPPEELRRLAPETTQSGAKRNRSGLGIGGLLFCFRGGGVFDLGSKRRRTPQDAKGEIGTRGPGGNVREKEMEK